MIRPVGKVTCSTFHGDQVLPKKARLKKSGYLVLQDEYWFEVDSEKSKSLLIKNICFHLEDDERLLDEVNVTSYVHALIDSFPIDTKFYTNYDGSFECISDSFLDVAVSIENSSGVIGLICIEDSQQP